LQDRQHLRKALSVFIVDAAAVKDATLDVNVIYICMYLIYVSSTTSIHDNRDLQIFYFVNCIDLFNKTGFYDL